MMKALGDINIKYINICSKMQLQMFWAGESASSDGNYNVGFFYPS